MSSRSNRVLAAEDEPLILAELQDMLADLGYEVVASELTLEGAMAKSRELAFDVAVLDINLAGERIDPVAEILRARGIPFITTSGYGQSGIAGQNDKHLVKPYNVDDLRDALVRATG